MTHDGPEKGQTGSMKNAERRDSAEAVLGVPRADGWWAGPLGDLLAAAVVLIGGGVLGGFGLGFGLGFGGLGALGLGGMGFGGPGGGGGGPDGPPDMGPEISLGFQITAAVATLFPAAAMFARRRWPITVLGVVIALCVVAIAAGLPTLAPGIAAAIAMFAVAFRAPRRVVLIIGSVATALFILLAFAAGGWTSVDMRVFQIGAAVAVAAALGDSARSRREFLRALHERAERAEQTREAEAQRRVSEERLRIARELHDAVGHQISVINLNAGLASAKLREDPNSAERALGTIRSAARGALTEIGELLRFLRADADPLLPQLSLSDLDPLLTRMHDAGLTVDAEVGDGTRDISGSVSGVAYRVVQEGLVNAHKHGAGQRATLRLTRDETGLHVEITNPVASAPTTHRSDSLELQRSNMPDAVAAQTSGFGLIGLRERVAAVRGTVESGIRGTAYVLTADLPLPAAPAEAEASAPASSPLLPEETA